MVKTNETPTGDDNALPPVNTVLILKRRYGGNDVISPERWRTCDKKQ
jgi:hypothetical protein